MQYGSKFCVRLHTDNDGNHGQETIDGTFPSVMILLQTGIGPTSLARCSGAPCGLLKCCNQSAVRWILLEEE